MFMIPYILVTCVRLGVQLDVLRTWIYMYSLFLYIFALRVSGAICTHPQEHKLQSTAIGIVMVIGAQTVEYSYRYCNGYRSTNCRVQLYVL
jgi:hypothetical protein